MMRLCAAAAAEGTSWRGLCWAATTCPAPRGVRPPALHCILTERALGRATRVYEVCWAVTTSRTPRGVRRHRITF